MLGLFVSGMSVLTSRSVRRCPVQRLCYRRCLYLLQGSLFRTNSESALLSSILQLPNMLDTFLRLEVLMAETFPCAFVHCVGALLVRGRQVQPTAVDE
ncbi:hypothetical protein BDN72DRAFT_579724 [Pluteus cervinus]|uniref:Uncharacterized protein n=1 Tax=Pluteus cervinus TaxID=181527 RepID=A0ACD3AWE5_9AGAR|nr:hypothetical protein BDN72DRAFT_579724 [Pluteus cervinus]